MKDREYCKRYREKLKLILTPEQKLELRKKNKQRVQKYQARKRAQKLELDLHAAPPQVRKLSFLDIPLFRKFNNP